MSDPKIVFKSDVPEEALISLAMFMMEEMERFIESDIGKEEFERSILYSIDDYKIIQIHSLDFFYNYLCK